VVALRDVAVERAQGLDLLDRLDALGDRLHAEFVGERDDRGDDRAVVAALDDAVDEGFVDLDDVDRQQVLEV